MENQSERKYELQLDPKILELLGPHLYTNIYYIIAELIANAYDADAKNVYVISKSDSIIVEDDGTGMSYEDTKKYLNVAAETRTTKKESYTDGGRRKIGRKGIGKLAALSVSENVWVMTIKDNEKSGFILSRQVKKDRMLDPLKENDMCFEKIKKNGTSIVMKKPLYGLSKNFDTIRRNLLKIFPLVDKTFQIHIIQDTGVSIIDSFEKAMIGELCGLITIGGDFKHLSKSFENDYPKKGKKLLEKRGTKIIAIKLKNKTGEEKEYKLEINGWIGVYRTTKGRRVGIDDFPDNFISLLSNGKLGEYNILPVVGKNKLQEVFVVGQLHINLFEETELPDMTLSNRQGYKTDDQRYIEVTSFVAKELLPAIVEIRTAYAAYGREERDKDKIEKQKEKERELRESVDKYKNKTSSSAIKKIIKELGLSNKNTAAILEKIIKKEMNAFLPIVRLKSQVDSQKKKILICHSRNDKDVVDVIYNLLIFNGAVPEDIISTTCDNEACRIPEDLEVWDYLKEFFVESYSAEKMYVVYVTSDVMAKTWGSVAEVGAAWITEIDHKVFNINDHIPSKPINTDVVWQTSIYGYDNRNISMSGVECDKFAIKIEDICHKIGYGKKTRHENIKKIKEYVSVT